MLAIDGELLIDNGANRQKGVMGFFFPPVVFFHFSGSRNTAQIGPSLLDSGDTEKMDIQLVKGKSFISVDPLGQVD